MKKARFIAFVALFIFAVITLPLRRELAQTPQTPQRANQSHIHRAEAGQTVEVDGAGDGFVIVRTEEGIVCRQMTARDRVELRADERPAEVRAMTDGRPDRLQQQGLKITLRSTQQLDNFPQAKEAFIRAAARWESIIQSSITIVVDVDYGTTFFGTPYPAGVIGATSPQNLIFADPSAYAIVRQALIDTASNTQQKAIYNLLPQNELPTDLGPARELRAVSANLRAIGELPPVANPGAETAQLGPPPAIGFNSAFVFDFDPSDGIDPDKIDFENAALHEVGHALGFVSQVGAKETTPSSPLRTTTWDFFRFRPGGLSLSAMTTGQRLQLTGGEQIFFIGDAELGLSTSSGGGVGGDGRQPSHWKDDEITGRYIGIMDPTGTRGQRGVISPADLTALNYFGYAINSASQVTEVLTLEYRTNVEILKLTNALVVNRFTPTRYPSTLQAVRLQIPPNPDGSSPIDQPMRIIAFVDQNRTGQPPANPSLIVDRMINIPTLPTNRFIEVLIPNPPSINSGDLYVGIQPLSDSVSVGANSNVTSTGASFVSKDNGASFQPLLGAGDRPANFGARAVLTSTFGSPTTPSLAALSPNAVAPGSQSFTLIVLGKNFQANSIVRWNGADRTTEFFSGSELRAQITAADVANAGSAQVTVMTSGGGESTPLNFSVTTNNPAPSITRLSPNSRASGSPGFTLSVFGANFTPQSIVRRNTEPLPTIYISSTQLNATYPAGVPGDSGAGKISVNTPGPGGGTTNELDLTTISCGYSLSLLSQTIVSNGGTTGVVLSTDSPCGWMASADVPWISITNPANGAGVGRFVVNYQIAPNTAPQLRSGTITIGGQALPIRQLGRATGVSAAGYLPPLSANAIAAVFGVGLATTTESATSLPLPTTLAGTTASVIDARAIPRSAQFFFASPNQLNILVPEGTATGVATVRVSVNGTLIADGPLTIETISPALFAANGDGTGIAAAVILRVKADNSRTFEAIYRFDPTQNKNVPVPIDLGPETDQVFLLLFGSGIRGRSAVSAVNVRVGDVDLSPQFAGAQPEFVGLDQVTVLLLRSLKGKGEAAVNVTVDGKAANVVTVTIQ